jgi:tape measure domain-containing protein
MADFDINLQFKDGQAIGQIRQVRDELDKTEKKAMGVRTVLSGLFAGFGAAAAVRELLDLSNASTTIDNRLKLVTNSSEELEKSFDRIREISTRTRSPLEENVALFQKVAQSQKELGASNEQLYQFVEAVGTALAIQGGAANTARGALIQLSQAIGGTIVRAEEFNSILEGALPLAQAAARGIEEAGGSVARLRTIVLEGRLTSKEFFDAIISQQEELAALFEKTNPTISQSFTVLRNEAITAFREFDKATGLSQGLAQIMLLLGENIGSVVAVLGILAGAFVAVKLAVFAAAVYSTISSMVALNLALGATSTAAALAGAAIKGLQLLFITNPIGLAVTALTVGIAALVFSLEDFKVATYNAQEGTQALNDALLVFREEGTRATADTALGIAEANREMAASAVEAAEGQLKLIEAQREVLSFQEDFDFTGTGGDQPTIYDLLIEDQQAYIAATIEASQITIAENKRVFDAIVANAEARERELQIMRQYGPEAQKQLEFYAKMRQESDAALQTGQEMLAKYQQQAELQRVIAKYGSDSYQAQQLRNRAELQSLATQLRTLDVSESLKNEILAAARAGQALGTMNVGAGISIAKSIADQLTSSLSGALSVAQRIANMIPALQGLSNLMSSLGGAASNLFGKAKDAISGIKLPEIPDVGAGAEGGGGGGGGTSFADAYGEMEKQIEALSRLGKEQDIYNKQQEIANQIGRELTATEAEAVKQAYLKIEVLQKASDIYDSLNGASEDYITTQAALNELVAQGVINQTQYAEALANTKLVQDLMSVDQSLGGKFDYQVQLQEVRDYTAERTNILNAAREVDLINEQEYQERLKALVQSSNRAIADVEIARWDMAIDSAKSSIDTLLGFAEQYAGKQSGIYKALFVAQKAVAVAEATVNTAKAVTNALAAPFPPPIPQTLATAAAVAGGAQIAAIIATTVQGLASGGRVRGPGGDTDDKAGLFALSNNEFVVNARAAKANLPLLEAMNRGINIRGMLAEGGLVKNASSSSGVLKVAGSREAETVAKTAAPRFDMANMPAPKVDLSVINVTSKEQALAAVASQEGTELIYNMIESDPNRIRALIGLEN